ncbi:bcl-2/adenovirus E1B 19 kDa-interacting protein 2-like protein isoform X3 [Phyllostomus discolor]|uniref:Bcl-2/adenovirus E1B 19 kDa-interacting protein 2-like protein n=1 Tax=Phyllostomus discolor TaxID=89673 RepID=A0A7E6CWS2_9CHIR|nr:bcl-2/adenovirus E1B 19 kDa-interacting protein 2-like protein isoform X3 [Phyllostomus discolor]
MKACSALCTLIPVLHSSVSYLQSGSLETLPSLSRDNLFCRGLGDYLRVTENAEAAGLAASLRLEELELKEEWQDEEFPSLLPEKADSSEDPDNPKRDLQADELPQAEGLGASEAAERLGQGCTWDVAGDNGHRWRVFRTGQRELRVDMTVIEPYKKVLSHGGYHGDGLNAVILFASCYLPRSSIPNYTYVMEHLFRYMVGTLELLVAENYLLVHLSGATGRAQVPPLSWIRQCYRTLDRRLRKNLRALVVVHATWYVKAFLALLRPFISSKFSRKVRFLNSLGELAQLISLDQIHIPEAVRELDQALHGSSDWNKGS